MPALHRNIQGAPSEIDLEFLHGKEGFAAHVKVSDAVVIARCIATEPHLVERDGMVFTEVQLEVIRSLIGAASVGEIITTSVPGGQVGDRLTVSPHSSAYDHGQQYILFLYEEDDGLTLGFDDSRSGRIEAGRVHYDGEVLSSEEVNELLPRFEGG